MGRVHEIWRQAAAGRAARAAAVALALMAAPAQAAPPEAGPTLADIQKAADGGDSRAMVALGEAHWQGVGMPRDSAKALEWFGRAAAAGNLDAKDALARAYLAGIGVPRDLDKALALVLEAVEGGGQGARTRLVILRVERGEDPTEAEVFGVRSAADEGFLPAAAVYGYCLLNGKGVPVDVPKGLAWLERAAELNEPEALRILGRIYASGLPGATPDAPKAIAPDAAKAIATLERLAALDPAAGIDLARMYAGGAFGKADGAKALEWFERAAKAGAVEGWIWAGTAFAEGVLVPRDLARAQEALQHAVDVGHPEAQTTLAALWLDDDTPDNDARALALVDAAMAQKLGRAFDLRATAVERGRDGAPTPERVRALLEQAVALGFAPSKTRLAVALLAGDPPADAPRAATLLEEAATVDPGAALVLARLVFSGRVGPADPARARRLVEGAVAAGYGPAFAALGDLLTEPAFSDLAGARKAWADGAARGDPLSRCRKGVAEGVATLSAEDQSAWLEACITASPLDGDAAALAAVALVQSGGNRPDRARITALFERAVAQGSRRGMVDFARFLLGDDPTRNLPRVRELAERAAAAGVPEGEWIAAHLDMAVPETRERGLQRLRKAADGGVREARMELGYALALGHQVPRDPAAALALFDAAAAEGMSDGDRAAALLLLELAANPGTPPAWLPADPVAAALTRLKRAIDAGDVAAMAALGELLVRGDRVPADPAAGAALFRRAAELGYPSAMTAMGHLHAAGTGVAKDDAAALQWFTRAADAHDPEGNTALGTILLRGELGATPDVPEARRRFEWAARAGDPIAMEALGVLVGEGQGGPQDIKLGLAWLYLAATRMPAGERAERLAARIRGVEGAVAPEVAAAARLRADSLQYEVGTR